MKYLRRLLNGIGITLTAIFAGLGLLALALIFIR